MSQPLSPPHNNHIHTPLQSRVRTHAKHANNDVCVFEYLNVNSGLYNKMYDINKHMIGDVVGVGETNVLFENDSDFQRRGYHWFNHPRAINFNNNNDNNDNNSNSGVAAWINNNIIDNNNGNHMTVHGNNDRRVWISIDGGTRTTFICFVYAPTTKHKHLVTLFWNQLTDETNYYNARGDVIIMGDMNAHVMNGSPDYAGQLMLDYMSLCSMTMINNTERCHHDNGCDGATWQRSTQQRTTIDYVLVSCTAAHRVKHMYITWNGNGGSDHAILRLHWYFRSNKSANRSLDTHNSNGQQNGRKWIVKYPTRKEQWSLYINHSKPLFDEWYNNMRSMYDINMNSYKQSLNDRLDIMNSMWTSWRLLNDQCLSQTFGRRCAVIGTKFPRHRIINPLLQQLIQQRDELYAQYTRMYNDRSSTIIASTRMEMLQQRLTRLQWYQRVKQSWAAYVRQRRLVRKEMQRHRWSQSTNDMYLLDKIRVDDSAMWWSTYKSFYRRPSPPLPRIMLRHDNQYTSNMYGTLQQWTNHYRMLGSDERNDRFDDNHYRHVNGYINNIDSQRDVNITIHSFHAINRDISMDDLKAAREMVHNHRAGGNDGIRSDLIVNGWDAIATSIHFIIRSAWQLITVPNDWLDSVVTPIFKDGDVQLCGNYRPISLMPVVAKLYERVLATRISNVPGIPDTQGGFRDGRGAIDHAFVLRELCLRRLEMKQRTFVAFIDLKSAYDLTWRSGIWHHLWHRRAICGRIWFVMRDMYRRVRSRVRVNDHYSPWFTTSVGVKQGSCLSPILFASFISDLDDWLSLTHRCNGIPINNIHQWPPRGSNDTHRYNNTHTSSQHAVGMNGSYDAPRRSITCLLYADDICLLAVSRDELVRTVNATIAFARRYRFLFNARKSGWIIIGQRIAADGVLNSFHIDLDGAIMPEVDSYKYLGVDITPSLDSSIHCNKRAAAANKSLSQLYRIDKKHNGLKLRVGRILAIVLARAGLLWGTEIITMPNTLEMKQLERPWLCIARKLTGASYYASHDLIRAELGWMSINDYIEFAKMAYFQRLRYGGVRVGLAAFVWRIRMGDAYHRLFRGHNARVAALTTHNLHQQQQRQQQRPQRRAASHHHDYSFFHSNGRTIQLAREQRCNSDDDEYDNNGNDMDSKRTHRIHDNNGDSNRSRIIDIDFDPLHQHDQQQQQQQQQQQRQRVRHYQHVTAYCEAMFYLFKHYDNNDEWWQSSSSQPLSYWKADKHEHYMSIVHQNWYERVNKQRRGAAIYLKLQPSFPSYIVMRDMYNRRGDARATINKDDLVPVVKLGARYICTEDRGGMWRRGTQWLFRYRIGDVPLAAMMAAVYDPLMKNINDIPSHYPLYSNKCQLCTLNAVENYDHVLFECPRYDHERMILRDAIHELTVNGINDRVVVHVPHSQQSLQQQQQQQQQVYTMMDDDVELFVAATQSQHDDVHALHQPQQSHQHDERPFPWQWWLLSPIIRELLSNDKYSNSMKRYLGRVMYKRSFIIKQQRIKLRRNAVLSIVNNHDANNNNNDNNNGSNVRNDRARDSRSSPVNNDRVIMLSSSAPLLSSNDVPLLSWSQQQHNDVPSSVPTVAPSTHQQRHRSLYSVHDHGGSRIRFVRHQPIR